MIIKLFIIFVMILIAVSLFSGLIFLIRDSGNSKRMLKSLSLRIGMSLLLFIFLLIAFKFGYIQPHGI